MGDTITSGGGIHNVSVDQGYDRRPWRAQNSSDWPTLTIETRAGLELVFARMGLPAPPPTQGPVTFAVEPAAVPVLIADWDTGKQTGDERLIEVLTRRPSPVYLRRGVNQILLHNRR